MIPRPVRLPWGGWWWAGGDVLDQAIRGRRPFEQGEQRFLLGWLRPGMTFLDLGAHHGLYTLLASGRVGPRGRVIAFEPSPRERRRLALHVRLNACRNVTVEPFALGDGEEPGILNVCLGAETGCNSLRPPAVAEPTRAVRVARTTLDAYLARHGVTSVDFMKIDVEGAELEVFRGAESLLERPPRPAILCELADVRTRPWGYEGARLYEHLVRLGFRWHQVLPDGSTLPCAPKRGYHENLLALPEERA